MSVSDRKPLRECTVPSAVPIAWKVTHKASGQFIVVHERLWVTARDTGARLMNCDRYEVTCEREEGESK